MESTKESQIILNEIKKTQKLYEDLDKYIIVKINHDIETDSKSFEFQGMFNDSIESIESTHNLTTLNLVLKELLNNNFVVNFDYEKY